MELGRIIIEVIKGDITEQSVESIVNPANNHFLMGGGVAGIIKKKGGKVIEDEARSYKVANLGDAIITSAGNLKAKYVIHAVTMGMDFVTNEDIIRRATYNTLLLAHNKGIESIAFPALGCGVGNFPYKFASKIMAQEVFRYFMNFSKPSLKKIVFVLYNDDAYDIFKKNVEEYLTYMVSKISRGPFLTVDGIVEYNDPKDNVEKIVLIERSNPPLGWALPGGFVDYGEKVEDAVRREIKEETNLDFQNIKLLGVYSDPQRDPRFHTVSVVFVGKGIGDLCAGSDASNYGLFTVNNLPSPLAFDHARIIKDYIERFKKE